MGRIFPMEVDAEYAIIPEASICMFERVSHRDQRRHLASMQCGLEFALANAEHPWEMRIVSAPWARFHDPRQLARALLAGHYIASLVESCFGRLGCLPVR